MKTWRGFLGAMAGAALFLAAPAPAQVNGRPARSRRSARSARATPTTSSRAFVLEQLSEQIGHSFVFENRPGAGGTIGSASVAKADPDGYTVLLLTSSQASQRRAAQDAALRPGARFRDGVAVRHSAERAGGCAVQGLESVADLVAAAKANPGDAELRVRGRRLGFAYGGRAVAPRAPASPPSTFRSAGRSRLHRGDGRTRRLLFPADPRRRCPHIQAARWWRWR